MSPRWARSRCPTAPAPGWREAFVSVARGLRPGRAGRGRVPGRHQARRRARRRAGGTVLVNAMEGEPASDKDKLLLIRSPHLVLDGAQLLAAASGARAA